MDNSIQKEQENHAPVQENLQEQQNVQQNAQQNVQQNLQQTMFDKRMQESDAIINAKKKGNKNDSGEMTLVKQKLSALTAALQTEMAPERNAFITQISEINDHYNQLIEACDRYLEAKWTAKMYLFGQARARRKMVQALRDMAEKELNCLSGLAKDKDLFSMRVDGLLIGNAVSSALRDYRAAKSETEMFMAEMQDGYYVSNVKPVSTDVTDEIIVHAATRKLNDAMKNTVCATNLASFMGLDGIMRRASLVLAKRNKNEAYYGVRNEGVTENSKSLSEIKQAQEGRPYKVSYTNDALKQITNAKLFHLLLGGKTLKADKDLIMTYDKTVIGGETTYYVTSVYLDINTDAFTTDKSTSALEKELNRFDFIMDEGMAQRILNVDSKDLEYVGGEMLSAKQRDAFKARLTYLKNWITETKEKEAVTGPSSIMDEDMWKDEDSMQELRDRIRGEKNGFFKGVLTEDSYLQSLESYDQSDLRDEYNDLYEKVKKNLDKAKTLRERVLIIGALTDAKKSLYESVDNKKIAELIVEKVQDRLLAEYANEDLFRAYAEELNSVQKTLAEAYEEKQRENPNDPMVEFDVVNENRTKFRDYLLLQNFFNATFGGKALGRDLRNNSMSEFLRSTGKKYLDEDPDLKEERNRRGSLVMTLKQKYMDLDNGKHFVKLGQQIQDWANKSVEESLVNGLSVNIPKVVSEDPIEKIIESEAPELRASYNALKNFKTFVLPQPPVYQGQPNDAQALALHRKAEQKYRDEIINTGLMFTQFYTDLQMKYLAYKKGKNVNPRLANYFEKIKLESIMFSNMVSEFLVNNKNYKKNTTWNDIIKKGSKVAYDITGLKNIGGGSSKVFVVKDKDGNNKYFKPLEVLKKSQTETFTSVANNELADYFAKHKLSDAHKKYVLRVVEQMNSYIKQDYERFNPDYLYSVFTLPFSYLGGSRDFRENTRTFYTKLCYGRDRKDARLQKLIKPVVAVPDETPKIFRTYEFLKQNPEKLPEDLLNTLREVVVNLMCGFTFGLNQFEVFTRNAKVEPGSSTSFRNVATSRVAGLLGISNLVCNSERVIVKDGKENVFGNIMEEAKGEKIRTVTRQKYTDQAVLDINTMIIFDILCGEVDRHEENFRYITHMEGPDTIIDSVHMIDNDMSFGNLDEEDVINGRGVAMPYNRKVLETIPNAVIDKIKSLDIKTLKFMLGDILKDSELTAMNKRLNFIKKEIKAIETERKKLSQSKKEADRLKAYCLEDETYRVLEFEKYMKNKKEVIDPEDTRFRSISAKGIAGNAELLKRMQGIQTEKKKTFAQWDQKRLSLREDSQKKNAEFKKLVDDTFTPELQQMNVFFDKFEVTLKSGKVAEAENGFTKAELQKLNDFGIDNRSFALIPWTEEERQNIKKKRTRVRFIKLLHMYEIMQENINGTLERLQNYANNAVDGRFDKQFERLKTQFEESKKVGDARLNKIKAENPSFNPDIPLLFADTESTMFFDGVEPNEDTLRAKKLLINSGAKDYYETMRRQEQEASERGVTIHYAMMKKRNQQGGLFPESEDISKEKKPAYQVELSDNLFAPGTLTEMPQDKELFPDGKLSENRILQLNRFGNDCYILSALYSMAKNNPDYIKNTLVKDYGTDGTKAIVHLFDTNGDPVDIVVDKTRTDGITNPKARPLWLNMVEKAANYLIGYQKADGRDAASFREKRGTDMSKVKYEPGTFSTDEMSDGGEVLAFALLFGKHAHAISTRDEDVYDEFLESKKYAHEKGDEAIAKILIAVEQGRIVIASTCTNGGSDFYDLSADRILFKRRDLQPRHVYTVIGEGQVQNGQRTVRVRDPYGKQNGGILDIPFLDFKRCFTDIYSYNL